MMGVLNNQHQPLQPQQGPLAQRSAKRPPSDSPHQAQAAFPSPNSFGQPPTEAYYGGFSGAELGDPMAAAQHVPNRQYQIYHTPQSNSPASVASSQGHESHRGMYQPPPPSMQQNMYYQQQPPPMAYGHPPYSQHPSHTMPQQQHPQMTNIHHGLTNPPSQSPLAHQQNSMRPQLANSPRPSAKMEAGMKVDQQGMKMDPGLKMEGGMQRQPEAALAQRMHAAPTTSQPGTPALPGHDASSAAEQSPLQPPSGPAIKQESGPGPIPATTPLVVRQDNSGVQWIAFEYSRDRVKMEYTIRCDVESVNVDDLDPAFKEENCVYPRACGPKELYKGNRLQYETECNTVGWSLAQLNVCLRGKRGLIQRAVDSWRNSNSDSKLRSRRVRRMNKLRTRQQNQPATPTQTEAGGTPVKVEQPQQHPQQQPQYPTPHHQQPGPPAMGSQMMPQMPQQRPTPPSMQMGAPPRMQRPHMGHDGSPQNHLVNGDYKSHQSHGAGTPQQQQMRQAQVFHGFPNYPAHPHPSMPSVPPQMHNGIDAHHLPPQSTTAISAPSSHPSIVSTAIPPSADPTSSLESPEKKSSSSLLPEIEPRKRKFILVEDTERKNRVRVKVNLDGIDIAEIPDSYRDANSVYPRSFYPSQMQLTPRSTVEKRRNGRFTANANDDDGARDGFEVRCAVKVPVVESEETNMSVPGLPNRVARKEEKLNDLGYRMSWSQSRTFAGRVIFLQRSLDAYRNKMKGSYTRAKDDATSVTPPLYETRLGKRRWVEATVGGDGAPTNA